MKSTRHSKITGDFGESLVLYYLSLSGFECARVDHTGIDLIARPPQSERPLGISVKTRSRLPGTEATSLNLYKNDFPKIENACSAFGCAPYIGLVFDTPQSIYVYMLTLSHLRQLVPGGSKVVAWPMSPQRIASYANDPNIWSLEWRKADSRWWKDAG
jgi:hypothetical protein